MSTYFISDIHLSDRDPHLLHLLDYFINDILKPQDELYILGDLFEYWIGDDLHSPLIQRVKNILSGLKARHIKWYFLAGNRDFLLGKKFLKQTNGELLPEKKLIQLGRDKVLLLHGDTLCTLDLAYQAWREKVNRKWLQKLFLLLPLKKRQQLAKQARDKSEKQVANLSDAMMDAVKEEVLKEFKTFQANVLIHGHTHRPAVHTYYINKQRFYRYVLSDWNSKGNYLKFEDGQYEMRYFDAE